jgi:hypothetical protein
MTQKGRARGFADSARRNGPARFYEKTIKTGNRAR